MEESPDGLFFGRELAFDFGCVGGFQGDFAICGAGGEAAADGLEVGFLAGPAVEEGADLFVTGEASEVFVFLWGEEAGGDVEAGGFRAGFLDVDADAGVAHDAEEHSIAGMGEVELKAGGINGRVEVWFTELIGGEGEVGGGDSEILRQDGADEGV